MIFMFKTKLVTVKKEDKGVVKTNYLI